jgi:hypothetical protein
MAFTKITSTNIAENTVAGYAEFANIANSLAPKITSIAITSNTYSVLDDAAVNVGGGYIVVTGSNFQSGATILIDTTPATSVSYINDTTLRAQVPAKSAASYNFYVVNPDGGTGIKVAGITYSGIPTWVTASPLDTQLANTAFAVTLSATGASSYSVAAGSTLPDGTTLAANGYFSGTVSIGAQTTYTFSIVATDSELQDSSKTFQVTVTVDPPDPYFNYTTLLLQADDVANNSNNNVFVDSSNNAYAVTSSGSPMQGSQNPFSTGTWSNYFDGSSYLSTPYVSANYFWYSSDFTLEAWVYPTDLSTWSFNDGTNLQPNLIGNMSAVAQSNYWSFGPVANGTISFYYYNGTAVRTYSTLTISANQWSHIAVTKTSAGIILWVNGVPSSVITILGTPQNGADFDLTIGNLNTVELKGYISNLRLIKGTALYTSTFTPNTTPLTAIANTQLLTCQSSSFKDNSNNAVTITQNNYPAVNRFNPFGVNVSSYSPSANSGSIFFNGTNNYLSLPNSTSNLNGGSSDFTIDGWLYPTSGAQQNIFYLGGNSGSYAGIRFEVNGGGTRPLQILATTDGSNWGLNYTAGSLQLTAWNHIALCRSGNSWYMFINGVQAGSTQTLAGTLYAGTINRIGAYDVGGAGGFYSGYMSNMRFIKGTALYTANFTPPATPSTTITNTQLLLLGNNAGIYDATMQNNIRTVDDVKVKTDVTKYGTGSIYFGGYNGFNGGYLRFPSNPQYDFGTGDFTIECWVYSSTTQAYYAGLISFAGNGGAGLTIGFGNQDSKLRIVWDGTQRILASTAMPTGAWTHIAVVRYGSTVTVYQSGVSVGTNNISTSAMPANSPLVDGAIGRLYWDTNDYYFNGYIDDFRITKGYARYTANFTPPTAVLPKK